MKKLFLLIVISSLAFVSCDDEDVKLAGPNSTIVGFPTPAYSENFLTNIPNATFKIPVNLISYANETFPTDVVLKIEVDPSSTAVAGTNFETPASNIVTIPAGSNSASFELKVFPTTFDPFAAKKVVFKITSVNSNNGIIGQQFEKVAITLQGVCPSFLAGNYTLSSPAGAPSVVTRVGEGKYRASRMAFFNATYWFEFSDVCDNLTITNWEYQGSNPISGTPPPLPRGVKLPGGNLSFSGVNVGGTSVANRSFTMTKI